MVFTPDKDGLGLPRDANNHPIQIAGSLRFEDATGDEDIGNATNKRSPQDTIGATALTLKKPKGAIALILSGDVLTKFGATLVMDGTAGKGYMVSAANTVAIYPCPNTDIVNLFIQPEDDVGPLKVHYAWDMGGKANA